MDEDVKLSMKQAHEKWVIKMTVFGGLIVLAMIIFWAHDCNRTAPDEPCNDAAVVIVEVVAAVLAARYLS